MGPEQLGDLDVIERRDIRLEELDVLSQIVFEPTVADIDNENESVTDPVTDFVETFATPAQLEALEKAAEGTIVPRSKEEKLWPRFRTGILWHPAVIGKIATLSGLESLADIDEPAWKNEGDCKGDIRFVSSASHRTIQETRELMDICENCPVLPDCHGHVANNFLHYGFWAGVGRCTGDGYHNGAPTTLEEKREQMDSKAAKAA